MTHILPPSLPTSSSIWYREGPLGYLYGYFHLNTQTLYSNPINLLGLKGTPWLSPGLRDTHTILGMKDSGERPEQVPRNKVWVICANNSETFGMNIIEMGNAFLGWIHPLTLQLFFLWRLVVQSWSEEVQNKTFDTARPRQWPLLLKSKGSIILVRLISRGSFTGCINKSWCFITPNPYWSESSTGVFRAVDSSGKEKLKLPEGSTSFN